jgi:hypothetical protein
MLNSDVTRAYEMLFNMATTNTDVHQTADFDHSSLSSYFMALTYKPP